MANSKESARYYAQAEVFESIRTRVKNVLRQTAINAEGFPLTLSVERPIEKLNGFLPASLRGKRAGFEW